MGAEVLILGGGVGGTLTANLVARDADGQAHVTVVDSTGRHVYQPGFLYVAVGQGKPENLSRDETRLLRHDVELVTDAAVHVDPGTRTVKLASRRALPYDYLVLATGSRTVMGEVPGAEDAHTFYTMDGAVRLYQALELFTGGMILVGVAGIPYKCPPAPVEFVFLLDDYLRARGIRERSEIKLLSPLNRAFTIETTSKLVQPILAERDIELVTFFNVETVDPDTRTVNSLEGESFEYDLLVVVPPHRGQKLIEDSGLGDERGWVPVDKKTLKHVKLDRIWALGDATDIPISKSGSVAHYESPIVAEQIAAAIKGEPAPARVYEGKVMCFLETGRGQATTIRFDYEHPALSPKPARHLALGQGAVQQDLLAHRSAGTAAGVKEEPMDATIGLSLDLKGLSCPIPIAKTARAMKELAPGQLVEVFATDPRSVPDFKAWSKTTGNPLLESGEEGGIFRFVLKKKEA